MYTKREVQNVLYELGMHIPLNKLGDLYDRLGAMLNDSDFNRELIKDIRGAWVDNGFYYAGYGDETEEFNKYKSE